MLKKKKKSIFLKFWFSEFFFFHKLENSQKRTFFMNILNKWKSKAFKGLQKALPKNWVFHNFKTFFFLILRLNMIIITTFNMFSDHFTIFSFFLCYWCPKLEQPNGKNQITPNQQKKIQKMTSSFLNWTFLVSYCHKNIEN